MRKERMTQEEYAEAKREIERIKTEIEKLRAEKNKLIKKINWYEYTEDKLSTEYENGFSYRHFGKRKKDVTEEERKEYQRIQTSKSRSKSK